MTRYSTHTATATFEVEVLVGGTFMKGYRETRDDPGQSDTFDDVEVEEFGGLQRVLIDRTVGAVFLWKMTDLLEGCDRKSPDIQRFLANVLAFIGDDAEAALMQEIAE